MPKNLKLKAARAEKDMTQGALAEAAGVSRQTINAIEKGEYNPTINLCRSICKILGKTLDLVQLVFHCTARKTSWTRCRSKLCAKLRGVASG